MDPKPVFTTLDLDEARSQPRAILFLWVNWSTQARQSEAIFKELLTTWKASRHCSISFYSADLSSQEGALWDAIRGCIGDGSEFMDSLTFGGCGGLLWLKSGVVVASTPCASMDREKLMAITDKAFDVV